MFYEFNLVILFTIFFLIILSLWSFYILKTDLLLAFGLKLCRTYCGMVTKYVPRRHGNGVWCYAERGSKSHRRHHSTKHHHGHPHHFQHHKKPTLIFLHGFGADKDMWPSMVKYFPLDYHLICLDMPGHGGTTYNEGHDEPTVESYVKSVKEFIEITHMDKTNICLLGCSFGGAVATLFSATYPEHVESLVLMCPAVKTPIMTEACQNLMNGDHSLLIPTNGKEFTHMIKLFCLKKQLYPIRIMQSFVNLNFTTERQNLLRKVLKNLIENDFARFEVDFKPKISKIKAPTLIIWGKNDEMLHPSGGKFLHEHISNARLHLIDDCNHVLQLDQPKKATAHVLDFLNEQFHLKHHI